MNTENIKLLKILKINIKPKYENIISQLQIVKILKLLKLKNNI